MAETMTINWQTVMVVAALIFAAGIYLRSKGYKEAFKIGTFIAASTATIGLFIAVMLVPSNEQEALAQQRWEPLAKVVSLVIVIGLVYALIMRKDKILHMALWGGGIGLTVVMTISMLHGLFDFIIFGILGQPVVLALLIAACAGGVYFWKFNPDVQAIKERRRK